jgi:pSer/pThr/pTyr-binding forkhead associated (FHA) protein
MALWQLKGCLDETKIVRTISLDNFPFVIGRDKSLDMVIVSSGISREHAEIYLKSGRLYIRDLGSTNGTFVNNNRISTETLLAHNTVIHFCESEFKLTDLDYKERLDEQMTVIVNVAAKGRSSRKKQPSAHAPQKIPQAQPKQIEEGIEKPNVIKVEGGEDSSLVKEESAEPFFESTQPCYLPNEKIFVRGGADNPNRRMSPRREARWPADVVTESGESMHCVTKDISETGLSLLSSVRVAEHSMVSVDVHLFYKGRQRDFSIDGVVKHSLLAAKGFIVGVQIKHCSESCSEFVRKYATHQV